jgi:hypothetical protein
MKFFIPALIIGAALNLFFFHPITDIEIRPQWTGSLKQVQDIEKSFNSTFASIHFPVRYDDRIIYINGNGNIEGEFIQKENLFSLSGNGEYIITYKQAGSKIELYNKRGDRFWMIDSLEYPHQSYNGKLAFLVNGDHSHVRVIDHNGNEMGVKKVTGRMCTALAFSDRRDFGALGFLDGSYYFLDEKGRLIYSGRTEIDSMIKGIAVNAHGTFGVIHSGSVDKDSLYIINLKDKSIETFELKNVHHCKTSIHITKNGTVTVNDTDRILNIDRDGDINFSIDIPVKRYGSSSIKFNNKFYAATYSMMNGEGKLFLFSGDGVVYMEKTFPSESFLTCSFNGDLILLRGSDNLYCYSLHSEVD